MSDTKQSPPLPRPAGVDKGWQEKIDRAKQARNEGRELRKDKMPGFPSRRGQMAGSR